jgi:hypothetical protein
MPWAVRPVMSRLAAMSRSRAPGSQAMRSGTRAWLVRKLQLSTPENLFVYFQKSVASFQLQM